MKGNKLSHGLDGLAKYCGLISGVVTGIFLVYMMLVITVDVIGRALFLKPILIADASAGYALAGMAFLGLAVTELAGKHVVCFDLTKRLPPVAHASLEVAILIVTLALTMWLTWVLFGATKLNYLSNTVSQDALHIRVWIPYSVGPLGTGMFAVVLLTKVIQKLKVLVKPKDLK